VVGGNGNFSQTDGLEFLFVRWQRIFRSQILAPVRAQTLLAFSGALNKGSFSNSNVATIALE
jgi:hypothetical protein